MSYREVSYREFLTIYEAAVRVTENHTDVTKVCATFVPIRGSDNFIAELWNCEDGHIVNRRDTMMITPSDSEDECDDDVRTVTRLDTAVICTLDGVPINFGNHLPTVSG